MSHLRWVFVSAVRFYDSATLRLSGRFTWKHSCFSLKKPHRHIIQKEKKKTHRKTVNDWWIFIFPSGETLHHYPLFPPVQHRFTPPPQMLVRFRVCVNYLLYIISVGPTSQTLLSLLFVRRCTAEFNPVKFNFSFFFFFLLPCRQRATSWRWTPAEPAAGGLSCSHLNLLEKDTPVTLFIV